MEADSTDLSPENGAPASRLTPEVRLLSAWMSVRLRSISASLVNAVMAIGTFWTFCLASLRGHDDLLELLLLRQRLRATEQDERAVERLARVGTDPFRKREIHVLSPSKKPHQNATSLAVLQLSPHGRR